MTGGPAEVVAFFADLRAAAAQLHRVRPEALREPLSLWFRAALERAERERWTNMLGHEVVSVWEAAKAINDAVPRDPIEVAVEALGGPDGVAELFDRTFPDPT
jgi:class 3 adenylate cyclase